MSKREKIIIWVMIAAIILAVIYFWNLPRSKNNNMVLMNKSDNLDEFTTALSEQISQNSLSKVDVYAMELAQEQWYGNPFRLLDAKLTSTAGDETDYSEVEKYIYSGYIKAGNRILGIINGVEHLIGEQVGNMGFIVKEIFPAYVIVTKEGQDIELPLSRPVPKESQTSEKLIIKELQRID